MTTEPTGHDDDRAPIAAPYGSWQSPIGLELVAGTSVSIAEPWPDGDDVYWLESRAAQAGRQTLLRRGADGATHELTPDPFRVGNRVHEYGGGSFAVGGGRVVVSEEVSGRLWRLDLDGGAPVAITPEGPWRYADLRFDPRAERLYAVRETHDAAAPNNHRLVANEVVALALDGSDGPGRVLVAGPDFVAAPRPSPDGAWLAWLEWDLPLMPWDASRLRAAPVLADGSLGEALPLAGGAGVSVAQPEWSPVGASSTPSRTRPAGGTCTPTARKPEVRPGLVGRWLRWPPSGPTRRGSSGSRPTPSPRTGRSSPRPAPTGGIRCCASRPTGP